MRLLITLLLLPLAAWADGWSSSNIQLLQGHGYEFGSESRTTMTLEHAQGWGGDDIYMFVDLTQRSDIDTEAYAEFYGQKSLWQPQSGLVSNISLSVGLNAGSEPENDPFAAYLAGVSFDFRVPGFSFVQLDVHAYKDDSVHTTGWQFTPVWELPFNIGEADLRFRGFVDVRTPKTNAGHNWTTLAQPQLLLDVGKLLGHKGHVYAGMEYQYWHNKFGVKGVDEHFPNAMLMYAF